MKSSSFLRSIESILSDHADVLNQKAGGNAPATQEFEQEWPELVLLFLLAQALKKSLVPQIAPRPLVNLLREDLKEEYQPAVVAAARRRRWVWIGAIASLAATATGVAMWIYRRSAAEPPPPTPSP